jgi:hypothetical protein
MKALEPTITDPTGAPNPFDRHTCSFVLNRENDSGIYVAPFVCTGANKRKLTDTESAALTSLSTGTPSA